MIYSQNHYNRKDYINMNSVLRCATIIDNATNETGIDKSRTLEGWHSRACAVRGAIEIFRAERDKAVKAASEKYKGDYLTDHIDAANADFNAAVKVAMDKVETDLQDVLDSKRRAWSKANSAPTTEMINLLTALQMRGNDLTDGEIMAVVEKLNDNAVALRSLRSICKKAGVSLPSFVGTDPDDFDRSMGEAEQYARNGIMSLATATGDLNYLELLFWSKPGEGLDKRYFKPLDSTVLTSEMIQRDQDDSAPSDQSDQAEGGSK